MATPADDPPWYVLDSQGNFDVLAVPPRLLSHPVLLERGIVPSYSCKPGVVYATGPEPVELPQYVIKILKLQSEELPIYKRILRDPSPKNHSVPCEITSPEAGHPLLIMPRLSDYFVSTLRGTPLYNILGWFLQITEGVEYLHKLRIAHLNMSASNVLVASSRDARLHPSLGANRFYIIDFDTARRYALGPGEQTAITLPSTQIGPPDGLTHFDPYSWDVYCARSS